MASCPAEPTKSPTPSRPALCWSAPMGIPAPGIAPGPPFPNDWRLRSEATLEAPASRPLPPYCVRGETREPKGDCEGSTPAPAPGMPIPGWAAPPAPAPSRLELVRSSEGWADPIGLGCPDGSILAGGWGRAPELTGARGAARDPPLRPPEREPASARPGESAASPPGTETDPLRREGARIARAPGIELRTEAASAD